MRDGLSLTDQAIAYGGGRLTEDGVRAMLGSVDRGHARAIVEALARRDGAAVLAAVDGLRGLGLSAAATLEEVAMLVQQMAVEQAVPGALDDQDPETADARALAGLMPADEMQLLYSMALHGRAELSLMSDEYGALTMVLLRFLAFPAQEGTAAVAAEPRKPEPTRETRAAAPLRAPAPPAARRPVAMPAGMAAGAAAGAAAVPPPAALPARPSHRGEEAAPGPVGAVAPPSQPVSGAARGLGDRWNQLVKKLCDQGVLAALLRELATQAGLRAIDEAATPPRWQLVVEREPLRTAALADKLAAVLAAELGHPVQVEFEAGVPDDSPARRDAAERQRRQAEAEQAIHNDPVVRELLSQFKGARIVPGSIKPP
jgi:DNA polymerase-3 subunit gamma/tau